MSVILGIDPGSTTVGYALIQKGKKIELLDYGVIQTVPKIALTIKLLEIGKDIQELVQKYSPDCIVVEKLYFTKNIKTGIDVAECRGVILYECSKSAIPILEFTPLEVKKAISGNGQASKKQMQLAIKMLLGLASIPKPDDAADAIAMAYMGALQQKKI